MVTNTLSRSINLLLKSNKRVYEKFVLFRWRKLKLDLDLIVGDLKKLNDTRCLRAKTRFVVCLRTKANEEIEVFLFNNWIN